MALVERWLPGAEPTADNLLGHDLDGDGVREPTWFLRVPATRLLATAWCGQTCDSW